MSGETPTAQIVSELALRITDECAGLSLVEADIALDMARRYIWFRAFSGASDETLEKELAGGAYFPLARRIVSHLDSIAHHHLEAEPVILEARIALWMQGFARIPGSLFAQQWQAFHERRRETVLQQEIFQSH